MIEPTGNKILLKRIVSPETTESGLYIADSDRDKSQATVIAVGQGKMLQDGRFMALPVVVGDTVIIEKRAGVEILMDGVKHIMVREDDILGIVRG